MAEKVEQSGGETIPFFPDHVRTEALVMVGVTLLAVIIGGLALAMPVGIGEPADPMDTPAHVKPEWYFLSLYQILKFVPEGIGVMLPILGLVLVMLWPFIDRRPNTPRMQRIRLAATAIFVIVFIALTIWGEVS